MWAHSIWCEPLVLVCGSLVGASCFPVWAGMGWGARSLLPMRWDGVVNFGLVGSILLTASGVVSSVTLVEQGMIGNPVFHLLHKCNMFLAVFLPDGGYYIME